MARRWSVFGGRGTGGDCEYFNKRGDLLVTKPDVGVRVRVHVARKVVELGRGKLERVVLLELFLGRAHFSVFWSVTVFLKINNFPETIYG